MTSRKIYQLFHTLVYILTLWPIAHARMLKISECGIYDAEFSISKKNHRFNKNVTETSSKKSLSECIMGCTIFQRCFSINYKRTGGACEYVSTTTGIFRKRNVKHLLSEQGWDFYETKDKKTVGAFSAIF